MSTLKDVLNQIATKANEEKKTKEFFLLHLQEQIINTAKDGNYSITLTKKSSFGDKIQIPDFCSYHDVQLFFKDSGLKFSLIGELVTEFDLYIEWRD
jgi:hypothetical protein